MNNTFPLTRRSPLRSAAAILLVTASMSACAPVSPTAKEDRALFERLCKASDRNFVKFRPSVNGYAEGYEHSRMIGCPITSVPFKHLIAEGYQYYECFQTPWIERTKAPLETLHMRLRATTDDSCQHPRLANENRLVQREKATNPDLKNICVGGKDIPNPESRFVLIHGGGAVDKSGAHLFGLPEGWPNIKGSISYSRDRIVDRKTGEVIAERKAYRYFPSGAKYVDLTGYDKCDEGWGNIAEIFSPLSTN